jgi:phosphoserine phosphatase
MHIIDSVYNPTPAPIITSNSLYQTGLVKSILELERRSKDWYLDGKNRIAVFDLDNTLLVGDIGDAVLARLLLDGHSLPLTWTRYKEMCIENPMEAYIQSVRVLNGFTIDQIISITKRIIRLPKEFLLCEDQAIRIPKPNPIMSELVQLLREMHYTIFVISASNDISAKVAASIFFDIPIHNVAGIKPFLNEKMLTDSIVDPVPVGIGKVTQYRILSGDRIPMIVATDSMLDFPLLEMCDSEGIAIIVGENEELRTKAKKELPLTIGIHQVSVNTLLSFQQQHRVA